MFTKKIDKNIVDSVGNALMIGGTVGLSYVVGRIMGERKAYRDVYDAITTELIERRKNITYRRYD